MTAFINNSIYTQLQPDVQLVRDALVGEPALKSPQNRLAYIPKVDTSATDEEYRAYVNRSEYDNTPKRTLDSMLGMFASKQIVQVASLPSGMDKYEFDFDGDGQTINQFASLLESECCTVNFSVIAVSFGSNAGMNKEQAKSVRPSAKLFKRESVVDWDFAVRNGINQLSYIVLCEQYSDFDYSVGNRAATVKHRYVKYYLDDTGNAYYQTKDDLNEWTESVELIASGQPMKFLPVVICASQEYNTGELPLDLGYIYPIAKKAIYRMQVSGDWKSALWKFATPHLTTSGWNHQSMDIFKKINATNADGSFKIKWGGSTNLPKEIEFGLHQFNSDGSALVKYFELNKEEARALGAEFGDEAKGEETATAARIRLAGKLAVMNSIAMNVGVALIETIAIMAMFIGIDYETAKDATELTVNKEFIDGKMTVQERQSIVAEYQQGIVSLSMAIKALVAGGIYPEDALEQLDAGV